MRRFLIIAIFLSLTILGQGLAESQPPAPGPLKLSSPPQKPAKINQPERQDDKRGTEDFPLFIKKIETESQKTEKDRDTRQREKEAAVNRRLMLITGGLLLVAVFQLGFFAWQLSLMSDSMKLSKTAAEAALDAANAAEKQAGANMLATRAYVRVNSASPGVIFSEGKPIQCTFTVKNYGETPAHITDIVIKAEITPIGQLLPYPADYCGITRYPCSDAFLVRNDSLSYGFATENLLSADDLTDIENMKKTISLYGYVDYIDAFGKRHRGHYGQNYWKPNDNKGEGMSNLTFLMQRGYNYDRERTTDEGNDWNYNQPFNPIRG